PGLADGNDLLVLRQADQRRRIDVALLGRLMRMGPDRAEHLWVFLCNRSELRQSLHPGRDRDDTPDPSRPRPLHHRVQLGREIREIEMAVAVDQHRQDFGFCFLGGFSPGLGPPSASGSIQRGKTGAGAGSVRPAAMRVPSAAKSRSPGATARRSSILPADEGTKGCARMATFLITSAVT